MPQSQSPLLHAYEFALTGLRRVEDDLLRHVEKILALADESETPTLRQLAFLEGLRRERDEAMAAVQQAEAALLNHISSLFGIPPDVVK